MNRLPASFIARAAAANDASILLGRFKSAGTVFDSCLEDAGLTVTQIGHTGAICTLTVTPNLANNFQTLHGGAISTLVDVVGTLALLGRDPKRPGVSVEMNQSFCVAAAEGETVHILGTVLRYGRTLGFTEVTMTNAKGAVVATGRHTKFFPEGRAKTSK